MSSNTWCRVLPIVSIAAALAFSSAGCAPEGVDDEDVEEASDNGSVALSSSMLCDVTNLGSKPCQDAIESVRFQGFVTSRGDIIERAMTWLDAGVRYDANASYQGYRKDCSGFVSMAWSYKDNPGTIFFPPFNYSGKYAVELGSFDDLAPGDAVNRKTRIKNSAGNYVGHVMLFGGWASFDRQELFLIHEYSTGKPAALIRIKRSELSDYVPIRSTHAPAPVAPVIDPSPQPEPTPTPEPSPACGSMVANQSLGINQGMSSCDGRFTLIQQGDGNLVLYQQGGKALWSTQTYGKPGDTTVMQDDGNLVIYGPPGAIWSSQSQGHPGAWLSLDDHGALIIFDAGGKPIWWNGTGGL
ncbi:MAG: hypothetical protein U0414_14665 [Polyangiaceae bacterium]